MDRCSLLVLAVLCHTILRSLSNLPLFTRCCSSVICLCKSTRSDWLESLTKAESAVGALAGAGLARRSSLDIGNDPTLRFATSQLLVSIDVTEATEHTTGARRFDLRMDEGKRTGQIERMDGWMDWGEDGWLKMANDGLHEVRHLTSCEKMEDMLRRSMTRKACVVVDAA
ncbi:uncharacterized protein EV422DRAFT_70528 [Fimicolochytrium jonesii]|uniref:uncharacterized protein n=1 Tax=Fimicolochytrium jonesii TaxID=1396493 RepID=UPI0022FE2292|nr:uncharacterized protein EV422DRAFT_70528 [Fimicolochytrium jonesii]KAI8820447.1 hypothetical protein EV422DRAFT_70528 [Fimicolochytrium jonesii]